MPLKSGFLASLDKMRTGDGRVLPPRLKQEIVREYERLGLVNKQMQVLERADVADVRSPAKGSHAAKIAQLMDLRSIGPVGGPTLVTTGLVPTGAMLKPSK